jgi:hypothetical protein
VFGRAAMSARASFETQVQSNMCVMLCCSISISCQSRLEMNGPFVVSCCPYTSIQGAMHGKCHAREIASVRRYSMLSEHELNKERLSQG